MLRAQCKFACYIGDQADRSCEWWSGRQGTQCFTIQPKPMKCECSGTNVRSCEWKLRDKSTKKLQPLDAKTDNGELLFPQLEQCVCMFSINCILQFVYEIYDSFITLKLEYYQK